MPRPGAVRIRPLRPADWDAVRAIYAEGIATGHATFETDPPTWAAWDRAHLPFGRIVALDEDRIAGWAALSGVSDRCVYAGVADVSLYVGRTDRGRGVGAQLLQALIDASEDGGIWTLQAGIFPENAASVALHRKLGFREVGRRERLGRLHGRWRDVLLFERRSPTAGTAVEDA